MSYTKPEMTILQERFVSEVVCTSPNAFVEGGGGNYGQEEINDNGSY